MKLRRLLCWLILPVLLLSLLVLPADGAAALSFIAVNDAIPLTLSGDELPFYGEGGVYLPYTAFNASGLSFFPSYNPSDKLMTLFSREKRLVFDLAAGGVTDEHKNTYAVSAVSRGGMVFLPAAFCAGHFDTDLSILTSKGGYQVVRFTTGTQIYDDSLFLEKAENLIAYRVDQHANPKPPAEIGPSVPENSEAGKEAPPEEVEQPPASICLAVVEAASMENALTILERRNLPAAFFMTADELLQYDDLARKISGLGYELGLLGDTASALEAANDTLDRAAGFKTLLALVPEAQLPLLPERQYRTVPLAQRPLRAADAAESSGETHLLVTTGISLAGDLLHLDRAQAEYVPLHVLY